MQARILTAALALLFVVVAAAALAVRAFLRATQGARGLGARIERLFHLPDRARPLAEDHYYHQYWRIH
jgi:hypothetical protein